MSSLPPLPLPETVDLETPLIWRALVEAHQPLAELKGLCASIPNPAIFIETLSIQEAKDSSEIENIITTHDELYASQDHASAALSRAAKEVRNYVTALRVGADAVSASGLIRLDTILAVQAEIEENRAGLRQLPGTVLKNQSSGRTVFEPPQSALEVQALMDNLIEFIHRDDDLDPLLRMAIVHHQFESIHPFYDGNGRTGRILNIMMLIREDLLTVPILYLSRYINQSRADYYRLLQTAREESRWEDWCLYLLRGIAMTARHELALIRKLQALMDDYQKRIRDEFSFYSQDLLNNLFRYPYTKIEFIERELGVSRPTATKYLDQLAKAGFVEKTKKGRTNFYINRPLFNLLTSPGLLT
ncbi:Fic family protein [Haloferula chungangensis]|uniref:Fic family protein n=1 Tax=Haloferula chungangensis TaxID=1048331 RepID=A0ABW2L739_9BACT